MDIWKGVQRRRQITIRLRILMAISSHNLRHAVIITSSVRVVRFFRLSFTEHILNMLVCFFILSEQKQ